MTDKSQSMSIYKKIKIRQRKVWKTNFSKGQQLINVKVCQTRQKSVLICITKTVYAKGVASMKIVRLKRPHTIAIKYLTSQAKLPCPSRKLHLLRTPF